MSARPTVVTVLFVAMFVIGATASRGAAEDGTGVTAEVPSVIGLTIRRAGPTATVAELTSTVTRTQLLASLGGAAPGDVLHVGAGTAEPRPLRSGMRLPLAGFDAAVSRARVVVRVDRRSRPAGAELVITAAPQIP